MSALLKELDHCRACFLRITLAFEPVRKIFVNRALRLFFFICFSLTLNFFLSLAVPIWMLGLGPLILGTTHLFAVFRFVPKAITENTAKQISIARVSAAVVLLTGLARILQGNGWAIPDLPGLFNAWEWLALLATFVCLGFFLGWERKTLFVTLFSLLTLANCSWNYPLATAAVLMIGHNFVPFFYWMKMSKNPQELFVSVFALLVFSLIHVAFLTGLCDGLAHHLRMALPDFGPSLDPLFIAKQIFPKSNDFALLERAVSVFAFGQAVHYFLWIKVLPEQAIRQEVPLTFSQSKNQIVRDLGLSFSKLALVFTLGFIGFMLFVKIGTLRDIYVAGVAAHGYAELAGLPFLLLRKPSV